MEGKLHVYYPKWPLNLFEFAACGPKPRTDQSVLSANVLLFIGGMFDNFLSPPYVAELAQALARPEQGMSKWTMMQVQLSSAGTQFGMSSLDKDVQQLGYAVEYIRKYVTSSLSVKQDVNIVLMGHSTGCQDAIHYLLSPVSTGQTRPPIQSIILQAPVSDREVFLAKLEQSNEARDAYSGILKRIESIPDPQRDKTMLPLDQTKTFFGPVPMSAARFTSLTSPCSPAQPEQDDLFSSDLTDQRHQETFGRIATSPSLDVSKLKQAAMMLVLVSGSDEYVQPFVDKKKLLSRWASAFELAGNAHFSPYSAVLEEARHDVTGDDVAAKEARRRMIHSVRGYLDSLVGEETGTSGTIQPKSVTEQPGQFHVSDCEPGKL